MTDIPPEPGAPARQGFLAHMGHEIRSPASSILAHAEALKNEVFGPVSEEQKDALRSIENSAGRLLEIFHDMQVVGGLARLPERQPDRVFALAEVTAHAFSFCQEHARRLGVTLPRCPPSEIQCCSDAALLRQMLIALLLAGIEAAEQGCCIRLTACPGNDPCLTLRMECAGFDKTRVSASWDALHQNPLFERAAQIARLLAAFPTSRDLPEVGWVVDVVMPGVLPGLKVADFPEAVVPAPGGRAVVARPGAPRILVAEDQSEISRVIQLYLESLGYSVVTASNGREAWSLCLSDPPDLLILDMHMPVMSGVEVMRRVRAHSRLALARVPIISLSGLDEAGEAAVSHAHGADAHLAKPFHLHQLKDLLSRVLPPGA